MVLARLSSGDAKTLLIDDQCISSTVTTVKPCYPHPFLVTYSRSIKFTTMEYIPTCTAGQLAKSLMKVVCGYARGGFEVKFMLMDMEFEKVSKYILRETCKVEGELSSHPSSPCETLPQPQLRAQHPRPHLVPPSLHFLARMLKHHLIPIMSRINLGCL